MMKRKILAAIVTTAIVLIVVGFSSTSFAQTDCEYPNVMIVLDRSGSMSDYSKWTNAKSAINTIVSNHGGKISFGLMMYPWTSSCKVGQVRVHPAVNNLNPIMTALNGTSPGGATPTGSSINALVNYGPINDPNKRSYVLLITDGMETCNGNARTPISTLYGKGIPTFVVGFGKGVDANELNDYAVRGGTQRAPTKPYYYQADNLNELNNAMQSILQLISAEICDGKDNNCNGLIDEDPNDNSKKLSRICNTACGTGREWCLEARWQSCDAPQPQAEICDGIDNDCDGKIDEPEDIPGLKTDLDNCGACFNKCPTPPNAYPTCINGVCGFECVKGYHKENGVCVGDCQPTNGGIEICDYIDNDCDGLIDEDSSGKEFGLRDACGTCDFAPEICNGKDDNCDGKIDEGFHIGEACDTGFPGICGEGKWQCDQNDPTRSVCRQTNMPTDETCNALDDDCNGIIDDGLLIPCSSICGDGYEVCVMGVWQPCDARKPEPEKCNGFDDDCNGLIDDGDLGMGERCETDQDGVCDMGHFHCVAGMTTCIPDIEPSKEICDGLDNDCNGLIDDNLDFVGKPCVTGSPGICAYGKWQCVAGIEICVPDRDPEEEVCDGIDNNCDGKIDEGLLNACGICGPTPEEICDGIDNNCDGRIDEETSNCRSGEQCIEGECIRSCAGGECPGSQQECRVVDGKPVCVTPCFGVKCEPGFACDEISGKCYDLCADVNCAGGQRCLEGKCVAENCAVSGCRKDQRCRADGKCEADPCYGKVCGAAEYCRDGVCLNSCSHISCAGDEKCVDGECVKDPCAMKNCRKGETCEEDTGLCVVDPCDGIKCPEGQVCEKGDCVGDPCLALTCPEGAECVGGQCVNELDPTGGGHGDAKPKDLGECVKDSDCPKGKECIRSYCEEKGTIPSDDDDIADDDDDNDDISDDDDIADDDDDSTPGKPDAGQGDSGQWTPSDDDDDSDDDDISQDPTVGVEPDPACGCRVR